ncbi:hypothetical protein AKO1_007677 [Acrasis kona]|uniref:Carbohydrate esterase 2 N-terminal domain-containing protein n=1 Tax=Acrasis kona TaxID=1008807 RepID=A0AAW2YRI7_9EUKA
MRSMYVALFLVVLCGIESKLIYPSDSGRVYYTGRVDFHEGNVAKFQWSGVSFSINLKNAKQAPSFMMSGVVTNYDVQCGEKLTSFKTSQHWDLRNYTVNCGDIKPEQEYLITITKRTEAYYGESRFGGFVVDEHAQVSKPEGRKLKMEFIGASVTCGYGNLGTPPCESNVDNENARLAYSSQTARMLNADHSIICWSGMGMARSYGDKFPVTENSMPHHFNGTLGKLNSNDWDFKRFIPQIVVINLGGNDYSSKPSPSFEQFSQIYNRFLDLIRRVYGQTVYIYNFDGPLNNVPRLAEIIANRKEARTFYLDLAHVLTEKADRGCNSHPSVKGDYKMAVQLSEFIKKTFKSPVNK